MKQVRTETNHFGSFKIFQIEMSEVQNQRETTEDNFHLYTCANFKSVTDIEFVADYESGSGSAYMYTSDGVYRKSDHWSLGIASCMWLLDGKVCGSESIGFCKYEDFTAYSKEKRRKISSETRKGEIIANAISEGAREHLLNGLVKKTKKQ